MYITIYKGAVSILSSLCISNTKDAHPLFFSFFSFTFNILKSGMAYIELVLRALWHTVHQRKCNEDEVIQDEAKQHE